MLEFDKEYKDTTETDTLGNRIRFAQIRINEWCSEIRDRRLMKRQNRGLCCSRLEDPSRFGCSDKIYKHKKKFKKKRFFKTNKKYYKRNKYKKKFHKKINLKEDLKPMYLKNARAGYVMKKGIIQMNVLKKRKQI